MLLAVFRKKFLYLWFRILTKITLLYMILKITHIQQQLDKKYVLKKFDTFIVKV